MMMMMTMTTMMVITINSTTINITINSTTINIINIIDATRTYPEHQFFAERGGVGQEALFNVMKAYSVHDREVGS